jgi:HEAT repeat protein
VRRSWLRRAILVAALLACALAAVASAGDPSNSARAPGPVATCATATWATATCAAATGAAATGAAATGGDAAGVTSAAARPLEWKEIERAARDGRPETRAWAVRQAANLGGDEAWGLVVEALRDPRAIVGDEALLVLATRGDAARLARLAPLLNERDPVVRARVAELLGRCALPVRIAWLANLAKDEDGEVARCALSALLRRAETGRLDPDEREDAAAVARQAFRGRDPVLQALAWRLAWRVAPHEAEESVRAALRSPDPTRRAAAASSLRGCTQVLALELAAPAIDDPEDAVRTAAMAVLGSLEHRGALRALADRLARETQPRLRHRLRLELANELGVDRGEDHAAWAADVAAWTGGVATRSVGADLRPVTSAHFSGLPLVSDRVAFLVDLSGSMWSAKVGDLTRKELVDRALAAALESLPRGARVQLVPYTARPIPWERAAVPLDSSRLRQALDWFGGRRDSGPGDFLEAFESVLVDEHIDSVCVLTDGVPTGGERHELGLLFDRILDRNVPRQLAVDALLVDCKPAIAARWSGFCAATGGVARRVRYEDLLGATNDDAAAGRGGASRAVPEHRRAGGAGRAGVADAPAGG